MELLQDVYILLERIGQRERNRKFVIVASRQHVLIQRQREVVKLIETMRSQSHISNYILFVYKKFLVDRRDDNTWDDKIMKVSPRII